MAARFWVSGGTGNWSSTTNWSATSGGASGASVPGSSDTATFNSSSGAGTATIDSSVTIQTLTIGIFNGTLAFGTNTISVNSTGTIFSNSSSGLSVTGTPLILCTNSSSTARQIDPGTPSEANSISFEITAGTGTVTFQTVTSIRSLVCSGSFTGNIALVTTTIYGNVTLKSGMLITSSIGTYTFAATSGTQVITTAQVPLRKRTILSGTATYKLGDNSTFGSSTTHVDFILTSGTLDLNNFTLSHYGDFISNGTGTRAINGGTTGIINLTGINIRTIWDMSTLTGFTRIGNPTVQASNMNVGGVHTILHGTTAGGTEARAISFNLTSNNGTFVFANTNWILDLNKSGGASISGGVASYNIYGSMYQPAGNTFGPLTFKSTSATPRNLPLSSGYSITVDGVGGSFQFQANATNIPTTLTITNGSFSTNGYTSTIENFNFNNSNTKSITINAKMTFGADNSPGVGTVTSLIGSMTNTTLSATGQIYVIPFGQHTHNVDGGTFSEVYVTLEDTGATYSGIVIGAAGTNQTITTLNVVPETPSYYNNLPVKIFSGSTLNVTTLNLQQTAFGTITLLSTTAGSQATLNKPNGTVLANNTTITDSNGTGGAAWRAPTNYGNTNGGNNTGWNFGTYTPGDGDFFFLF